MDDDQLTELLRESGPPTRVPLALADHRRRIVTAGSRARIMHRRNWFVGGSVVIVLLAGGGAATAGSDLVTPWGWTAENTFARVDDRGVSCYAGVRVEPEGVADDAPIMIAAREIASGISLDDLDTSAAERRIVAENADATGDGPRAIGPSQLRREALDAVVAETVFEGLREQGFPTDPVPVSVYIRERCGAGE
jgi:hypothetical protein